MSGSFSAQRSHSARRLIVAAFCWTTAAYAFMSASPFVYRQFLAPRVFEWLGTFGDWHARLYWAWFVLAVPTHSLRAGSRRPVRIVSAAFVVCGVLAGVRLVQHPLLPRLVDDSRSVIVGVIAVVPVFWLALIDYLEMSPQIANGSLEAPRTRTRLAVQHDEQDGRLLVASVASAIFVAIVYAAETPLTMGSAFEPDLLTTGLLAGFVWSLVDHLLIFCGAFVVLALVTRVTTYVARSGERPTAGESLSGFDARTVLETPAAWCAYAIWIGLLAVTVSLIFSRTVGGALGLSGWPSAAMALASGTSVAVTWSALRLRRWVSSPRAIGSELDLLLGPPDAARVAPRALLPLVVLAALAYGIGAASRVVDWDFLVLRCGVFALWLASFDQFYRLAPRVRVRNAVVLPVCLVPLGVYAAAPALADGPLVPQHALSRYAVYTPSFRVADGVLRDATAAGDDGFQRFLREHTAIGRDVDVSPMDVDFARPGERAATTPDIFLFVIDSLRRDYLQPYNRAVGFTPSLERFAAEAVVFGHAFTAYGGTGLSVPAIWSGAFGVHKQYVTPFDPMNALAKLLERNGYRRFLSMDSIVKQILPPSPSTIELDRGLPNEAFRFCRTVGELQSRLDDTDASRPVFAYTLPQDLHVSNIISASVPPGKSYSGFHAPYAARVHAIDACFGQFVDFLKRRGRYDRSLIVLTADHGEMLGEEGLWGHVYYLFPPVVEVPLLVHLPAGSPYTPIDTGGVSFTTDITPTIYAVTGYAPTLPRPLQGRPLVESTLAEHSGGDRNDAVLTASYSAVYAALQSSGDRLYIIDAVQHREYAYERGSSAPWRAAPVNAGVRESGRRLIRQHVHALDHAYRVTVR